LPLDKIHLHCTGTASGILGVSGTGFTRTVTITNIAGDGSLTLSVDAGVAADDLGNLSPVSGQSKPVVVDNTPPSIQIGAPSASWRRTAPSVTT